jgi:hypothetical protein
MVSKRLISSVVLLGVLAAAPAFAAEGQRRRNGGDRGNDRAGDQGQGTERAVPRSRAAGRQDGGRNQAQQAQVERQYQSAPQVQRQYQAEAQRQYQSQGQYRADRQYDTRGDYAVRRDYQRPYYPSYSNNYPSYSNRGSYGYGYGYGSRTVIVPRYITPRFVTVVPYRPYVYRPSIGIGVYYGTGGSYPYGYTPRGYYDPIAGRPYGGLRITGFSQIAQVFADGYYVGIVNDFDGAFQHLNLEAGPHQIEIREPGLEPIAFDVMVQAGRTITFRAGGY